MTDVTVEELQKALPANLKTAATQELADKINQIQSDPLIAEQIRENFISYTHVLKDGRFKTEEYLNAVTYVSFKVMGLTNREAYEKTFPERMAGMILTGRSSKEIAAYVAAYNKGKLVNLVYEQTMIPVWVLNQDAVQKAINTQLDIMANSQSDKARVDAANSILTHLKKPEVKEFQLSIETKENSGMREMQDMLTHLAQKQLEMIENGTPTHLIAAQPLVQEKIEEGEFTDVKPD
jgi:hypothetical protein